MQAKDLLRGQAIDVERAAELVSVYIPDRQASPLSISLIFAMLKFHQGAVSAPNLLLADLFLARAVPDNASILP